MDDLISRTEALKALEDAKVFVRGMSIGKTILTEYTNQCRESFMDAVRNVEATDADYIRHGCWIVIGKTEKGANILRCSVCGIERRGIGKSAYCRDCGGKMDLPFFRPYKPGTVLD